MKLTEEEVKDLVKWIVESGVKDALEDYINDAKLEGKVQAIGLAFVAAGIRIYEKGIELNT